MNRRLKEKLYFSLFRACGALVVIALGILLAYIIMGGIGTISLEFLTQFPKKGMTEGGIFPAIVGTIYLCIIVILFSVPVGVLSAIYFVEYERNNLFKKILRVVVHNLAGVPSIVYGLLGLGLFVMALDFGFSLIAAGLTVGLLVLPLIISATREALLAVPNSVREASIALGATKWQTVRHHVVPYAMSGILTGIILSLSRAAGETAPILMTGAAYYMRHLPDSIFSQFMALPFHLYTVATQSSDLMATRPIQYGTAFVLLILVIGMNLMAIILRRRFRKKYRW
ncbi:MAG: phosphate ABC transporter permease PstA [Methanomassiliicoccales archaeon]